MKPSIRNAALLATLTVLVPTPAQPQSSGFLNGLGYAVTGATTGALTAAAAGATECSGSGWCIIPDGVLVGFLGGGVLGVVFGSVISSRANRTVAAGRPVGGAHLAAVSVGTVIGGATLGLVAGSLLINDSGTGTFLGSDEQTMTLFTLAGATLAILHLRSNWGRLTGAGMEVEPALFTNGSPGVVARFRF